MKAVYIENNGSPEALQFGDRPTPAPGAGEVLIKIAAAGINFIDTYQRSGLYKIPLPAILGSEAGGTVEALGEGVTDFKPGDRVAFGTVRGAYAEYIAAPAAQVVKIPDAVEFRHAAAAMLQGMTAHYLTQSTFPLKPGHTALVHASAGGTGRLIVQMAKNAGARVIGTAGSAAKAQEARAVGADQVILYNDSDFAAEAKRLTGGKGVDVVYDSVGQATFQKSLDSLKPRGMMVTFGNASGAVPPMEPLLLTQKGSLFLTRPMLAHHVATRDELLWRSGDVFRWIAEEKLTLKVDFVYPLADAAQAHRDLEGRKTSGKLILLVG
jgi:NADPH2:quinone reductase